MMLLRRLASDAVDDPHDLTTVRREDLVTLCERAYAYGQEQSRRVLPESGAPSREADTVAKATAGLVEKAMWENADPELLEPWYTHWVGALTAQGLHDKADIATVLAILSQRAADSASDVQRLHRDKMDLLTEKLSARSATRRIDPSGGDPVFPFDLADRIEAAIDPRNCNYGPSHDGLPGVIVNFRASEWRGVIRALRSVPSTSGSNDARDAERYRFLRTNYSRMIISICCGTNHGQTIEEAEVRLDRAVAKGSGERVESGA